MEKLLLPKLGQTMEEGTIVEWFVQEGAEFNVGDDLYEVETEKSNVTVEATVSGTLHQILVPAGTLTLVGSTLGIVRADGEQLSADEIAAFAGSELNESDTESESTSSAPTEVEGGAKVGSRTTLDGLRRQTARVVSGSWQEIPHFQQVVLADATNLIAARATLLAESTESDVRISLNDLLLDRIVSAIKEVPTVNASYQDGEVILYADINVAIAVATDHGLLTPVLHRSEQMSLKERANALRDLVKRSAEGQLKPADLDCATITVSNLGMHGVDTGFALVTKPQAAIVFVGQICKRPMVIDDVVVARDSVYLSASYDHRVVDGAGAAQFLSALRRAVER
jgi:pyruvate dehydrogenase E2 component (dihydrolipoamide acetyltransferase)